MLAQEVTAKYPGQVSFVSENFGASKLAERFGVKGYPSVFVDDVLVASPRDFGVFGGADGSGRYAPWRNAENQARFKEDLSRMIDLILAGHKNLLRKNQVAPATAFREITELPKFHLSDLSGKPIELESLAGKPVVVEFWATWCLPCRSTLEWLADLKRKYGDKLVVVALAVESPEDGVRSMANSLSQDIRWGIADGPTARLFGDVTAVPTMFVFDKSGRTAKVLYGAPPDLHEQVAKIVDSAVHDHAILIESNTVLAIRSNHSLTVMAPMAWLTARELRPELRPLEAMKESVGRSRILVRCLLTSS